MIVKLKGDSVLRKNSYFIHRSLRPVPGEAPRLPSQSRSSVRLALTKSTFGFPSLDQYSVCPTHRCVGLWRCVGHQKQSVGPLTGTWLFEHKISQRSTDAQQGLIPARLSFTFASVPYLTTQKMGCSLCGTGPFVLVTGGFGLAILHTEGPHN